MWALGLLGAARRALAALWALAVRYPLAAALVVALSLSAWLWMGWNRADRKAAAAWAVVAEYKEVSAKATAWALAEKAAKEAAANDITKGANDARSIAQAAGVRAGDDYASRNRCVRAANSRGQHPDLPRPDSVAGQPAQQADNAELVGVTRPDFNACTVNSLDLANAQGWAADMVARGLAK